MVCRPSPSSPSSVVVHTFKLEYLWSQLANLDQILCVASLGWGKGWIRFWGRLAQNSGFHGNRKPPLTYNGENDVSTFSRLFLICSFLYLQVTKTCIKSQTSLNFGQIRPLTSELAALEQSKKFCIDLHQENAVSMRAHSFLIESSSKLLVTRTGIKARTSLISGRIRLLTLELLALEWRNFYSFKLEYLWGQLANLDQILCVASLGVGKGCIMLWGRLDQNSGIHGNRKPPLTYNGENGVSTFSRLLLIQPFLYLQVKRICIKSRMSSNSAIGPLTMELSALEHLKNFP